MDTSEDDLRRDSEARALTDRIVSKVWVLLPIAYYMFSITVILLSMYVSLTLIAQIIKPSPGQVPSMPDLSEISSNPVFSLLAFFSRYYWLIYFAFQIPFAYLIYVLVKRRNNHFLRQKQLTAHLVSALKSVPSGSSEVEVSLSMIGRTSTEMDVQDRSAILFSVLTLVPIVDIIAILYLFSSLTVDFYQHERKEDVIIDDLSRSMNQLGVQFSFRRRNMIPKRSVALSIVLTVITGGIFSIYWLYTLIQDPNMHFMEHISLEDDLMAKLPLLPRT